jgi:GT2 family glycosyltransferase
MLSISVIIPNHNRSEALKITLENLAKQTLARQDFEVLIVDDGSTDNSMETIQEYHHRSGFNFLQQTQSGPAVARNNGVLKTSGEICVFLDADMVPKTDLLEQYLLAHRSTGSGIAIGRILTWKDSNDCMFERVTRMENFHDLGEKPFEVEFYHLASGNFSIDREDFRRLGGFDGRLIMTEDTDLGFRAKKMGIYIAYCPKAIGYHNHPKTFVQRCQQIRSSAYWTARLFMIHNEMSDLIPIYQDILPINFKKDSIAMVGRKIGRYLLSLPATRRLMGWAIYQLEGKQPDSDLLRSLYWKVLGGYRFEGFQTGVKSGIP